MSLSKVNKNINNLDSRLKEIGNLRKIPVILSDSKGNYLREVVDPAAHPENKIYFWCRRGTRVYQQYEWLKENFNTQLQQIGSNQITLYVWLGTCDLTEKSGQYIKLRSNNLSAVNAVCKGFKDIFDFIRQFSTVTLIFLEIPFYSVYLWNLFHKHPEPEKFRQQDKLLESQIIEVNKYICQLNTVLHTTTPSFCLDLERNRKHKDRRQAIYSLNYGLYTDGVHPCPELAKLWLIRIALRFPDDCR